MRIQFLILTLAVTFLAAAPPEPRGPLFAPAPGSPQQIGGTPGSILSADVDGDGRPDLVVTDGRERRVVVLLGDGRGGFRQAPGSPLTTAVPPHMAAVGDLDGDRRLDLLVTGHDSFDVYWGRGDGRGGVVPSADSPVRALDGERPHNHGLAAGDVDGDGDLDVLTTDDGVHAVAVLLGDGRGGLRRAPGSPFRVGQEPYPLALADVNGDGRLDVVTPDVRGDSVSVLLGDGRGAFAPAPQSPLHVTSRPYFVALGDVDGDRRVDAVVSHDDVSLVTVLLGDGAGGFRPAPDSPLDLGRRVWKTT